MKSVKEENGVNRKAANLDRLSKENLSEEVTFVQVRKQTMQRSWGMDAPVWYRGNGWRRTAHSLGNVTQWSANCSMLSELSFFLLALDWSIVTVLTFSVHSTWTSVPTVPLRLPY